MKYRVEIDGLRAVAVVPVILFHAGFEIFSGGFVGVDIFFVISGYLITLIIISELERGKFSLLTFYERRARRILPALFFVLIACLPFAWMLLSPDEMKGFAQSLVAVSTFSSNIFFWREVGYFDVASELKPLLHTWSLAVEEQYYIFFPLFMMLAWRLGQRWILALLAAAFVVSLGLGHWGVLNKPAAAFFLLPTRAWELLVGVFSAFYLNNLTNFHRRIDPRIYQGMSALGLTMIAYSIFAFNKETSFPGLPALVPTVGTALIILFATQGTWVNRLLSTKGFVGVGLISYSAYLWHQPLMVFARHRSLTESSEWLMGLLCIVTLIMAYISWRYVEQPFRQKQNTSRKLVFSAGMTIAILTVTAGVAGHVTNGFIWRIDGIKRAAIGTAKASPKRESCHANKNRLIKPEDACVYFDGKAEWATFGDSHTVELAYALAQELSKDHQAVRHFSFSLCSPSYTRHNQEACTVWTKETLEYLVKDKGLMNVVVSYRTTQYLHGGHEGKYPSFPNEKSQEEMKATWESLVSTIKLLADSGKNVILVLQAPEVAVSAKKLIFMSESDAVTHKIEGVSADWWRKRMSYVTKRLDEMPELVRIVDPAKLFCDRLSCYAVNGGKSLYFDDDHMSIYGAGFVAREILNRGTAPPNFNPSGL